MYDAVRACRWQHLFQVRCFTFLFSSLSRVDYLSVLPLPAYKKPRLASSRARQPWLNSPPLFPLRVSEATVAHPRFRFRSRACESTLPDFPPFSVPFVCLRGNRGPLRASLLSSFIRQLPPKTSTADRLATSTRAPFLELSPTPFIFPDSFELTYGPSVHPILSTGP